LVQNNFEMVFYVEPMFFPRVQDAHQYAAGIGTSVRYRSKADLAGDDGGSEISFGEIIVGRDPTILSPVVEAGLFRIWCLGFGAFSPLNGSEHTRRVRSGA
jgi:hypothetical protein